MFGLIAESPGQPAAGLFIERISQIAERGCPCAHEGFTNYSEVLFTEYYYGKQAADEYLQGLRNIISNDIPIIGTYGVNKEGSGDMYPKGANLLHTVRQIINNDSVFRSILRGLNKDFYHQTVTSKQVEDYFSQKSGKDLSKVFDQYLRTIMIPVLQLKTEGSILKYKWSNCIKGFNILRGYIIQPAD